VTEAHAEHRHATGEGGDDGIREAGVLGATGAGADQHSVGGEFFDLFDRERIAAMHEGLGAELAQVLDEVEHERVVVVEDENAGGHRRWTLLPVPAIV
jgi:hypothetical protein